MFKWLGRRALLILLLAISLILFPASFNLGWQTPQNPPLEADLSATPPADTLQKEFRNALELAASAPADAIPALRSLAFSENLYSQEARMLLTSLQGALLEEDQAFRFTISGQALANLDEWELAQSAFQAALAIRPDYAEAWAYLAEARQQLGKDGAFEALQTAHDLDPLSVSVNLFEALYWQRRGNYDRAAIPLKNAVALDPNNPLLQIELGQNQVAAGNFSSALLYYENALLMDPEDADLWKALAAASIKGEFYLEETGLLAAHWARYLDPADPEAETILGQVLFLLGHLSSARAHYRNALDLDPGFSSAHLHLAIALIAEGRLQEAFPHLDTVVSINPESSEASLAKNLLQDYSQ